MPRPLDAPEIDPLQAYRCQTDRAWRLTEFLLRFAPSVGERAAGGYEGNGDLLDEDADPVLAESRDDAIEAAFDAVRRIALNS